MDLALIDVLEGAYGTLEASMREAGSYAHGTGIGDARESAAKSFLRRFLPESIQISKGRIIDSDGATSPEYDIILHVRDFSPTWLDAKGGRVLVPVEAALMVIELKSKLDAARLEKAVSDFSLVLHQRRYYGATVFGQQIIKPIPEEGVLVCSA